MPKCRESRISALTECSTFLRVDTSLVITESNKKFPEAAFLCPEAIWDPRRLTETKSISYSQLWYPMSDLILIEQKKWLKKKQPHNLRLWERRWFVENEIKPDTSRKYSLLYVKQFALQLEKTPRCQLIWKMDVFKKNEQKSHQKNYNLSKIETFRRKTSLFVRTTRYEVKNESQITVLMDLIYGTK